MQCSIRWLNIVSYLYFIIWWSLAAVEHITSSKSSICNLYWQYHIRKNHYNSRASCLHPHNDINTPQLLSEVRCLHLPTGFKQDINQRFLIVSDYKQHLLKFCHEDSPLLSDHTETFWFWWLNNSPEASTTVSIWKC